MLTCSFCGLDEKSVGALLAGPGVNICNQCIDVSVRTIATCDALEQPGPSPSAWKTTGDEAVLHEVAATSKLIDKTRDCLQSQITELRHRGVNWTAISAVLGVSQQITQERFE